MCAQALQNFFAALVYSANTSFDSLLESLLACAKPSPQSGGIAKQALHSIAQCVAVLCLAAGDQKCTSTVKMLTDILKDDSTPNSVISLSLSLPPPCFCFVVFFFYYPPMPCTALDACSNSI
jgi:cullin-associated NEDD8-dissociated protein 1